MVFSFPSLSVFSAKDNKNQQIAFYSFSLSNYWNIFTNYRNVNVSLKPLSLSFEEIKEMMCMKRMVFSIVCIGNKCADNVGRMSTEDARKLSVGTSVWLGGENKGI
jgi:hypothetical protein